MAESVDLVDLASGYWQSFALGAAVELGLFSELAAGPVELCDLAGSLDASGDHLEALLNSLCGLGLVKKSEAGYEVDPEQKPFLDPASPDSMLGAFQFNLDLAKLWLKLPDSIRSGEPVLPDNPHLGKDPERTRRFVEGMHSRAGLMARGLLPLLKPESGSRVLDVGGGPGTFSLKLAERDDSLRISVLDLPPIVEAAKAIHSGNPVSERILFLGGDYHQVGFPVEQDMVLYFGALHQEPESGIEALFTKMKQALKPGGALVVVDLMLDSGRSTPVYSALFQLNMMLMRPKSRVYTSERVTELLQKTGFANVETREVPGTPYRMVKALKD
jgi:ubiquinone/menaquinone biosynthesis C-methylase UbiE